MCWKMLVGRLEKTGLGIGYSKNAVCGCGSGLQSGSRLFGNPVRAFRIWLFLRQYA